MGSDDDTFKVRVYDRRYALKRAEFAVLPAVAGAFGMNGSAAAAAPGDAFVFARQRFIARATLPFRHRQVFGSRSLASGVVLHLMTNSLKAYHSPNGFDNGPHSLHAAAVLYGTSITAVLTDAAWVDLRLPEFLERLGDLAPGNPAANPFSGVVADLTQASASFFVCNNALHDVAQALAAATPGGRSPNETYTALFGAVKPNAIVVPAGVAALNALQEYHFTLVQATM